VRGCEEGRHYEESLVCLGKRRAGTPERFLKEGTAASAMFPDPWLRGGRQVRGTALSSRTGKRGVSTNAFCTRKYRVRKLELQQKTGVFVIDKGQNDQAPRVNDPVP
jgi:hypothetical protein